MKLRYTEEHPSKEELYELYENLGWNRILGLDPSQLMKGMENSWYVIYVYDDKTGLLVGTGRVISDGVINGYLCGIGVNKNYRQKGIGSEIFNRLVKKCKDSSLHVQLFCEEELVPFYQKQGFEVFALGMKLSK